MTTSNKSNHDNKRHSGEMPESTKTCHGFGHSLTS
jgi:hypothetical protein